MFEEALSLLSIWASMNSWLTPTVLFLLLNLMIGTIAVTSALSKPPPASSHHHQPQLQTQLTRSSSVLHRLKSFNFYSYIHAPQPPATVQIHPQPPPPATQYNNNSSHRGDLDVSNLTSTSNVKTSPYGSRLSEVSENLDVDSLITHVSKEAKYSVIDQITDSHPHPEDDDNDDGPTLDEVYSQIVQKQSNPHYGRQNSDTEPAGGEVPVRLPAKMKKSASDKSAFNHFQAVDEHTITDSPAVVEQSKKQPAPAPAVDSGGHEVDARADDFINRFRQQLKMQRLDSIVRYKEMITRGSGK